MDISYLLWLQDFRNGLGSVFETYFLKMSYLGEKNVVLTIMAAVFAAVNAYNITDVGNTAFLDIISDRDMQF
ncbi:hypothetical protein [Oribacterium sp. FC2011]|uniref:hypothetical protein n=1 Tax=Oribacterium sp. FC2011 TaxID=1408311 RepID=UPI0004E25166|nr:hypothetical protein [Oribacterium sp. FC2011]